MNVTRLGKAPFYHPPAHDDMRCLRLQGHEAGPSSMLWLGLSHLLPGGKTSLDASPLEKLYFVVEGEVTVSTPDEEVVLHQWDSCRIAPGEARALRNASNRPASILLAMPLPPAAPASA
ncbi:cupin domain-containing protein [Bosea sp. NPDC055332]